MPEDGERMSDYGSPYLISRLSIIGGNSRRTKIIDSVYSVSSWWYFVLCGFSDLCGEKIQH